MILPSVSGVGATLPSRRIQMPMAHHYSFTLEQQLGRNVAVSAAYVGTIGQHLIRFSTPNLGQNSILFPYRFTSGPSFSGNAVQPGTRISPQGRFTGGRPDPTVGAINVFETTARSRYDAMQLQIQGRLRRSIQWRAEYVLSKALDDVSDVYDLAGASSLPQNSRTFAGEWAVSNFDVHHRFSYEFAYKLPELKKQNPALRILLGGFQLTNTARFRTGQPFTVNSIFDVNLDGNLTDRIDTTAGLITTGDSQRPLLLTISDPTSLLAPVGQDGRIDRNSFRAANVLELDLSLAKTFELGGSRRVIMRADAFNFTNRANFGVPLRFLEGVGFGQAIKTITPARRVQLVVKFAF